LLTNPLISLHFSSPSLFGHRSSPQFTLSLGFEFSFFAYLKLEVLGSTFAESLVPAAGGKFLSFCLSWRLEGNLVRFWPEAFTVQDLSFPFAKSGGSLLKRFAEC